MNNIEILAPCGSQECVEPAVRCGANAIYLGSTKFSARASAQNFDRETLKATVDFCHQRNVDVHLAINTLISQSEIKSALDEIEYACEIGVDAIIIQDLGLYYLAKKVCPLMQFHASTQMSIHSAIGVKIATQMGYDRVVLSRELSKKEIAEIIKKNPNIETEVFIHGALCMCLSGQCYFSAMLGGRSGNRGECAQTCRLPFKVGTADSISKVKSVNAINNSNTQYFLDEYALSLKDLSGIEDINELINYGVSSIKIEGRMKRPEYVAGAVTACRNAIDKTQQPEFLDNALKSVFSRSGFTNGYLQGNLGSDMFGIRCKEDVQSATKEVFGQLRSMYRLERQCVAIDMSLTLNRDEKALLTVTDQINSVEIVGDVPQIAQSRPFDIEKAKEQLKKTGGTPFYVNNVTINMSQSNGNDMGITIPMSQLNKMRKEATEKLLEFRKTSRTVPFDKNLAEKLINSNFSTSRVESVEKSTSPKTYRGHFLNIENIPDEAKQLEIVYIPLNSDLEKAKKLFNSSFNIGIELPRGLFGMEEKIVEKLCKFKEIGIKDVYATNIAHIKIIKDLDMIAHGGFSLNVFNSYSAKMLYDLGVADFEWSFEQTISQIEKCSDKLPIKSGIIGYGRLPLMLVRNCPIKNKVGDCTKCDKKSSLVDRKGIAFPVRCYNSIYSEIFNSVPIYMLDRIHECGKNDFISLRFTVENSVETVIILNSLWKNDPSKVDFTRGLYYRGV